MSSPPICCDARHYMQLGQRCADHFWACWDPLRPIGSSLFFSIPFRLGVSPRLFMLVVNVLLVLLAALVGARAISTLLPRSTRWSRAGILAVGLVSHGLLTWRANDSLVTDVAASVGMTTCMWLLVLGQSRGGYWRFAVAGAALAGATLVRSFYLYPAVLVGICCALLIPLRRLNARQVATFGIVLALPIFAQYSATRARTGSWGFIDNEVRDAKAAAHFETTTFGYDTIVEPRVHGYHYRAPQCFDEERNFTTAAKAGELGEVACLLAYRQWYYLGSYAPAGKLYLSRRTEREFSVLFFLLNALTICGATAWVLARRERALRLAPLIVLLGAVWAEASLITPEARFLMGFHMAIWLLAAAAVHEVVFRWDLVSKLVGELAHADGPPASSALEGHVPAPSTEAIADTQPGDALERDPQPTDEPEDRAETVTPAAAPAGPVANPAEASVPPTAARWLTPVLAITTVGLVFGLLAKSCWNDPNEPRPEVEAPTTRPPKRPQTARSEPAADAASDLDSDAAERWRKALRESPEARKRIREVLENDPEARRRFRERLLEAQEE